MGGLIALFERAVGFYATLVGINAYHQPGVEAGKKAAEALQIEEPVAPEAGEGSWLLPNWVDLRGEVPKAAVRLAKVTTEVTQHGTQEQQKQAAAVLDEARKSIHKILASE